MSRVGQRESEPSRPSQRSAQHRRIGPDLVGPPSESVAPSTAHPPEVTRVLTPGLGTSVEMFASARLVHGGRVHLLSLEVLAQQRGARWALRRTQIHKYVDERLRTELGEAGTFLQVSETDFLVCLPYLEPAAAQLVCLRCLRTFLQQFIGSGARATEGLFQVHRISVGHIEAISIGREPLLAAEAKEEVERDRAQALARATEPFVPSNGRAIRVSCGLEPLLKLNPTSAIGLRLAGRVVDQEDGAELPPSDVAGLAGVDIMRVDWATIVHGLAQLRERDSEAPPPTLIVPISYASLSSPRGRAEMFALVREAHAYAGHGVVCEISDLDGAPRAALEETVSLITPLALFVVAKLTGSAPAGLRALRGVGFRGLAFDCPRNFGDAELLGWSSTMVAKARQVGRTILFYGVGSERLVEPLARLGATHVSLGDRQGAIHPRGKERRAPGC